MTSVATPTSASLIDYDLEITVDHSLGLDPEFIHLHRDYSQPVSARILLRKTESSEPKLVVQATGTLIKARLAAEEGYPINALLDALDGDLFSMYVDSIANAVDVPEDSDLLFLTDVKVARGYRKRGLELALIRQLGRITGSGVGLVVAFAKEVGVSVKDDATWPAGMWIVPSAGLIAWVSYDALLHDPDDPTASYVHALLQSDAKPRRSSAKSPGAFARLQVQTPACSAN